MASNNRVDIVYSPPQEERFDVSRIFNPRKVFAIFPEMNGTNIYGLMEDGLEKHGLAEKGANGYIP